MCEYSGYSRDVLVWLVLPGSLLAVLLWKHLARFVFLWGEGGRRKGERERESESTVCCIHGPDHIAVLRTFAFTALMLVITLTLQTLPLTETYLGSDHYHIDTTALTILYFFFFFFCFTSFVVDGHAGKSVVGYWEKANALSPSKPPRYFCTALAKNAYHKEIYSS